MINISTLKNLKLNSFSILLLLCCTLWIVYLVLTVDMEFNKLKYLLPYIFTDLWKTYTNLMSFIIFLILFFNLGIVKRKAKVFVRCIIILGMVIFGCLVNALTWNYTIQTVGSSGRKIKDANDNSIYVDYQTKYSIQQIQLATVILSLPSLYAIIMIILTNYYWQKPVKD